MPPKKKKGKGKGKGKGKETQPQQQQPPTQRQQQQPPQQQQQPPQQQQPQQKQKQQQQPQQQQVIPGIQASAQVPVHTSEKKPYPSDAEPSTSQEAEVFESQENVHATAEALSSYLMQSLTLSTPLVKRPDHGTRGRKIALVVNYFPLELPSGNVYHYDVEIILKRRDEKETDPKKESEKKKFRCLNTKKNREVIQTMLRQHREFDGYIPAYDGEKNMYTRTPLGAAPTKKIVELQPAERNGHDGDALPRGDIFEVSIKPVIKRESNDNAISLDLIHALYERTVNHVALEAIMALETILRNGLCLRYVPIGRSFFYPPQNPGDMHPLNGGKEIWFGHHQGLILTEWQPVVNVNVTATTFHQSVLLIAYVCEILHCSENDLFRTPRLRDVDTVLLSKKLKGIRIKVTHLSYEREYRVLKLTRESSRELRFSMRTNEGPREITVFNYFSENYGINLRYLQLPCLQVQPEIKKIYLPLEVCRIVPGQHSNERLTEEQTRDMIRVASLPPDVRFRKIQQVLSHEQFNRDPCMAEFGIRVSSRPMNVEGRVIEPPNVMYSGQRRVRPRNGSWEMNDERFFRGAQVNAWVILSFVNERFCTRPDLERFAGFLRTTGQDCGLILGSLKSIDTFDSRHAQVARVLEDTQKRFRDVKFAVVVLQGKNSPIYGEIKHISETKLSLITQCVQVVNVKKSNRSVIKNICLKINAKMDGINCSLTPGEMAFKPMILDEPVIIFGADVTHPTPGSSSRPSIAAVVATLDSFSSRYAVELRAQSHSKEKKHSIDIIDDLEVMVKSLLKAFYRETKGQKPEKIIFYRDGVSKGEFQMVRDYELRAIRNACQSLEADYKPGITFIVVQKRHHTRFIPQDSGEGVGPRRNVPPGTVVDKGVSSIMDFDFFLCSHFGLQGTSRPGHYTVISDDNKFMSDELQKLTYYLCHISARCTKSISIPVPVAYAHLAAYRATKYLAAALDESSAASSSDISSAERQMLWQTWIDIISIIPEMKNKLFFV